MKLNLDTFALILDCFDKKAYINVVMQTCTDLYALGLPKLLADYREPDSLPKALTFLHYLLEKPNRRPPCLYSLQLPTFELGSRRNVYKEHAAEFMATLSNVFYKTQNLRRLILDLSSLPELDMADLMPLQESCRVLVDLSLSGVSASTLLAFLPSCTFPLRHIRIGVPSASNSSTSTVRMDVLLRPFSATLEYVELKVYNWSISNSAYLVWPNVQTLKTFHPPEGGGLSNSFPNLRRLEIQADSTAHSASPQREYHWEHLDLVKLPPRVLRKMLADTAVRKLEILDDLPIDDRVADALARARPVWLKMSAEVAEAIEVAPKLPLALVAGTLERLRLNLDFAPNMHTRGYTKEILVCPYFPFRDGTSSLS